MSWELSPLWEGQAGQFGAFQKAIWALGCATDIRHGKDDPDTRIRIGAHDINGLPITITLSIPSSVLDDITLAVQQLTQRKRKENEQLGFSQQFWADADLRRMDKRVAAGEDRDVLREQARAQYEEAARRTQQPDDVPTA